MKAAILGAGAWGTAIAAVCARAGHAKTLLWGRDLDVLRMIAEKNQHPKFPDIPLPDTIICEPDIARALEADIIFCAIPTQKMRDFLKNLPPIPASAIFVNCSKGLEQENLKLPYQVIADYHQGICLTLAGPNFASEIIKNLPAATVIAGSQTHQPAILETVAMLKNPRFRPYYHFDQIGLEAVSMVKNVIAIASGIAMAMQLGENARMALLTRSLQEIAYIVDAFGGKQETIYGLGGIGDLMLTCSSRTSRNTAFGYQLAKGEIDLQHFIKQQGSGKTIEGVFSAKALKETFPQADLPICNAVYQLLYENISHETLLTQFFERPIRAEILPQHESS